MSFHVSDINSSLSTIFAVAGKQDPKMIKCYHESSGGKFQHCMKDDGFETCFSKFDHGKLFHSKTIDWKKKLSKVPFARKSNRKLRSPADIARLLFQEENVPHRVRESYEWHKVRKSKMLKKNLCSCFLSAQCHIKININGKCPKPLVYCLVWYFCLSHKEWCV